MSGHHHFEDINDPGPIVAPKFNKVSAALAALGVIAFIVTFFVSGQERAWVILLQAMLVPTFIGAAALFFIAVNSVGAAHWIIPIRRVMEGLSHGVWISLPVFLVMIIFGGANYLYDWYNVAGTDHHADLFHVHHGTKSSLMVPWRFIATNAVFFALFIFFQRMLVYKNSVSQDGSPESVAKHKFWSILYLLFFAPSITLIVWDLILSLHVNWFSTMWGVYCFTSAVQVFLCVTILIVLWLRKGQLKNHVNHHTLHDLGTWMVGWSCFCAYIGFSQYMLIYYTNLDEETYWYVMRTQNGWGLQYCIEAFIRWPLVFLGLMSQSMRARPAALGIISSLVLVANWLDWSWMILPAFSINSYSCPFSPDLLILGAGFFGALMLLAIWFWKKHGLIPKGDPRLLSAMNGEHMH